MKVKLILTLLVGVLCLQPTAFAAYNFSQSFSEVMGIGSIVNAYSPARDANGNDAWVAVNSKTNQPRSVGTSPHKGTDLSMAAGRNVYAIYSGTVVSKNTNTSSQLGDIVINLDTNNDGTADGYYIKYWSCQKKCSLKTPSYRNPVAKLLVTAFFRDR